jgi:hypothetical protein
MNYIPRMTQGVVFQKAQFAKVCAVILLTSFQYLSEKALALEAGRLRGHVPIAVAHIQPVSNLSPTNQLRLAIGLPLQNEQGLNALLGQIYDPASPLFGRFLEPAEFAARFGPSAGDYQAVVAFAQANGLTVTSLHPNRLLVSVAGSAAAIQSAFNITLRLYPHPTQARLFYATDVEPAVPQGVPILHISGLDDYVQPTPRDLQEMPPDQSGSALPRRGTGPSGAYTGLDFRAAYVPGTSLTGKGQRVGLFELNGYYPADIATYTNQTGLPNVSVQNILIDGFSGSAGGRRPGSANEEVALDIEMALSMAPGLDAVLVYEGSPASTTATINDILSRMATDNQAKQLSCSWGFDIDINSQQIFKEYAAQGQSFFLASGDSGAFSGAIFQPSDDPFITVVGGTQLTTDTSQAWQSEIVWSGSSGGISTVYSIPLWQQGIDMSANGGSTTMRNVPDVAMIAYDVSAVADNGRTVQLSGTSIAAPLWAGFTALVNEQAASLGKPPIGFLNPAIYAVGKGTGYSTAFHDIKVGSNANQSSLGEFSATTGYDLCTGWGTPNGANLINALLGVSTDGLVLSSYLGFTANGPVGGPFNVSAQSLTLSNASPAALSWSVVSTSSWLTVSPDSGTLPTGGLTNVTVSLNANAPNLLIGSFSSSVSFQNLSDGVTQTRDYVLMVGNGGFENGDLRDWTFTGQSDVNFAASIDESTFDGQNLVPGVDDSQFAHSGLYGAFLGQNASLGSLSQNLPTQAGAQYLLSLWMSNPAQGNPNEFKVQWNGTNLFDQTDMPLTLWTNLQFTVVASASHSALQFGFRNDQNAFALDDISVTAVVAQTNSAPAIGSITRTGNSLGITWSSVPGKQYQVQAATAIAPADWADLGEPITAIGNTTSASENIGASAAAQFFRIEQL